MRNPMQSTALPLRALTSRLVAVVAGLAALLIAPLAQAQLQPRQVAGVTSFEQTFLTSSGRTRRVRYFRPAVQAASPAPVIVALHYGGGSPEGMTNIAQLRELVRDTGVWVILPEASGRAWNHDPARDSDVDVDLLTRVIDNATGSLPINPRRVYMTGFSSGAFMAMRYACDRPERIAAMAYVSSTLLNSLEARCTTTTAMPTLGIHGTADLRVSYYSRIGVNSAPDTARFFARRNGCLGQPVRSRQPDLNVDLTTVDLDSWDACASGKPVRFYTVNGGGHAWPGTQTPDLLLGPTTRDIDATRVIWDFFRTQVR